jgi:myosin protein heavy chain
MIDVDERIPENDIIPNSSMPHRSLLDIKNARETRTSEALRIKDEQIRILTDQNNKLLEAIEKGEEEISAIQLEKLHVDDENRNLRESIFSFQSKAKVTTSEYERLKEGTEEREQQFTAITAQHAEVVTLLEAEEEKCRKLSSDLDANQIELRDLKVKHTCIVNDLKATKEDATKATKTSELQCEEIRLLRKEVETLKKQIGEVTMQSSVEIESLQEQLSVRKEKQYQLLERLQNQEETRRQAEDKVSSLEERIRNLHSKSSSVETQLQLEISSKLSQTDLNNKLSDDNDNLIGKNKEITLKLQRMEQDQFRMEAEAHENGEQLREMAEKVFQLLERLKLAELGKSRSMEALRTKEDEVHGLKKKLAGLVKEHAKEMKLRAQIQTDKAVLDDQIRELKKHNLHLGQRCKEEARLKVKMDDGKREAEAKVRTLNSRLAFLLNKLQTDEESRGIQTAEMEKLQGQIETCTKSNQSLQNELDITVQKGKEMEETLREKGTELESIRIKLDALQQLHSEQDQMREESNKRELTKGSGQNPLLAGGRLRFFVDSKPSLGVFVLKGKCAKDRDWLETNQCNIFMKKASKSQNKQDILLHKIAETYGVILTREEEIEKLSTEAEEQAALVDKFKRKLSHLNEMLGTEEESKRRTLIKYINAVKASVSLGEPGCEKNREEVGSIGAGKVQLAEVSRPGNQYIPL